MSDRNTVYLHGTFNAAEAREKNQIGQKLRQERKAKKLSLEDVCLRLESYGVWVNKAAVSKWETGLTVPSAYVMLALCAALGVDDAVSYFTGHASLNTEGRKKLAEYKSDLLASGKYNPAPTQKEILYRRMPVSYLAVSAGTGNFLDDDNFDMVAFPENAVPAGADFAVKVSGDSMEPVYADGQTVWVKKGEAPRPGQVGIFVLDGSAYIKMYDEQTPSDPENYTDSDGILHPQAILVSYNKNYPPIVVSAGQRLEIIGRVVT